MDIEKMTIRVQKSLNEAYNEAVKHHNQMVDVILILTGSHTSNTNVSRKPVYDLCTVL